MTPELTRIMHDWRQLLFVPSSLLCYGVTKMWNHYRGRHWHTALETGLAPIGGADPGRGVCDLPGGRGGPAVLGHRRPRRRDPGLARAAQPADPARGRRRRLRPRAWHLPNKLMPELERTKPGAPFMP
jgi:hypothetical protein